MGKTRNRILDELIQSFLSHQHSFCQCCWTIALLLDWMQKGINFVTQKMLLQVINTKSNHTKIAIAALDTTYEQMAACVNNLEGETGRAGSNTF